MEVGHHVRPRRLPRGKHGHVRLRLDLVTLLPIQYGQELVYEANTCIKDSSNGVRESRDVQVRGVS